MTTASATTGYLTSERVLNIITDARARAARAYEHAERRQRAGAAGSDLWWNTGREADAYANRLAAGLIAYIDHIDSAAAL